jgi:hypothetical protein
MSASRFVSSAFIIGAICLLPAFSALAQSVPPEAYRAKTIFIRNKAGGAALENAADEELSKWGGSR